MKIRSLLILLAIAFQVGVVAVMAISREWILANGTPHIFQTAPVDPRDIFRGDYVRLTYLFSTIPATKVEQSIIKQGLNKGQKVYLSLEWDINGLSRGVELYQEPPADQPYLTGRVLYEWPMQGYAELDDAQRAKVKLGPVSVKYGIEQFYVEQGSGLAIERIRGERRGFQLPMLIETRISDSGEAVIAGYEWADIAIKTELVSTPERDAPDDQASAVVGLSLKNLSGETITLPLLAGNCSFALIGSQQAPADATHFAGDRSECDNAERSPVTLATDEVHTIQFDLNRPQWRVEHDDKLLPPGRLPWHYRYRIAYRGETIAKVRGSIISRAFHGRGNID